MPCCDPDFEESVFHQVQYVSIPLNSTLHSTSLKWPFQDKLCRFLHHWCHSLTCIHVRLHTIHLYILFCKRTGFLSHKGTLIASFYKKTNHIPLICCVKLYAYWHSLLTFLVAWIGHITTFAIRSYTLFHKQSHVTIIILSSMYKY